MTTSTPTLHELEPAAEWRAADVADPAAWTLRLSDADHAELACGTGEGKEEERRPACARARRLPARLA